PLIGVPSYITPAESTGTSLSLMRHLPVTSKLSSARPSGSITRWHDTQAGFLRCSSIRSRVDSSLPPEDALVASSAGTFGGGGGGGGPTSTSMIHLPRITGDVRSATDRSTRMLPWP